MFQIEAADLVIRIDNRFDYVRDLCRAYITSPDRPADIAVSVTEEEMRREIEKNPDRFFGDGYAEGVIAYQKISCALPAFDAFVMHSSAVAVEGGAYCFAAASGTGKSTHTRYWKQLLGDRVTVINGDKPICRFLGDQLMVYGTPWCGKENWQTNASAPMRALCLLERSRENAIFQAEAFRMLGELMRQFYLPGDGQANVPKMVELIDRMISTVPVYRLRCREDISAAETAAGYFGLIREEKQ